MRPPRVSVVIPTHNRLDLLAQTLRSVLVQDLQELEAIVVDDASEDATSTWLEQLRDPRVRSVRHDAPRGVAAARNTGSAIARAPWLAFVDDDDLWTPDKLTAQLAAADAHGAAWAFGGGIKFLPGPRLFEVAPADPAEVPLLPWRNTVPGGGSNVIVRRRVLEAVGGFDTEDDIVADWDMWIRLLAVGRPAVVRRPVVAYRLHDDNMSGDVSRMLAGIRAVDERYRHLRGDTDVDWPAVHRWLARMARLTGDQWTAVRLAAQSVRARHAGAPWHLLRASIPIPPRLPVPDPALANTWFDRLRPRPVLPWPDGLHEWLEQALMVSAQVDPGSPPPRTWGEPSMDPVRD